MEVNIVFDSHQGKALLSALEMRNVAYVTARALTSTAQECQKAVKKNLKKKFILRNTWTEKGVRIQRAEKTAWPNQTAIVGSTDDFMVQHEDGGKKQPRNQHIALPRGVRNSERELIPRKFRPKKLQLSMKVPQGGRTLGAKTGTHRKPKPFVAIPKGKKMGIYIRTGDYFMHAGRRKEKYRLLWRLWDRPANIEKKEWLYKTVDALSSAKFKVYFDKYMEEALNK